MATITSPVLLDETGRRIAHGFEALTSQQSLVWLLYKSGLADTLKLDPTMAAYRIAPTPVTSTTTTTDDTVTVTIPTPDISDIPPVHAYYCFDLEISVAAGTTTLVAPPSGVAFDDTEAYSEGDYVIYGGKLYVTNAGGHAAGAWADADFTEVANAPLSWTWLDGGMLPDATTAAGKTLYVSCRLDCVAKTIVANCWRFV